MDEKWTPATPEESRRFFRILIIMTAVNVTGIIYLSVVYLMGQRLLGMPYPLALLTWIFAQALVIAL